jgi:hypothetical protein
MPIIPQSRLYKARVERERAWEEEARQAEKVATGRADWDAMNLAKEAARQSEQEYSAAYTEYYNGCTHPNRECQVCSPTECKGEI